MERGAVALFVGLACGGVILGALIGEVVLGRGSGLVVAPVAGIVGLALAWMLRASRPTGGR